MTSGMRTTLRSLFFATLALFALLGLAGYGMAAGHSEDDR